jgi:hypothetical protein
MLAAFIGWVLISLSWILMAIIFVLGQSFVQILTYDNEVTSYIVIHILVMLALVGILVYAYQVQHRDQHPSKVL